MFRHGFLDSSLSQSFALVQWHEWSPIHDKNEVALAKLIIDLDVTTLAGSQNLQRRCEG